MIVRMQQKFAGMNCYAHFGGDGFDDGVESIELQALDIIEQLEDVDQWYGGFNPEKPWIHDFYVDCPHAVFVFEIMIFGDSMAILSRMWMETVDSRDYPYSTHYIPTDDEWKQVFTGLHNLGWMNMN